MTSIPLTPALPSYRRRPVSTTSHDVRSKVVGTGRRRYDGMGPDRAPDGAVILRRPLPAPAAAAIHTFQALAPPLVAVLPAPGPHATGPPPVRAPVSLHARVRARPQHMEPNAWPQKARSSHPAAAWPTGMLPLSMPMPKTATRWTRWWPKWKTSAA